jgi:hypothetical protein
MNSRCWLPLMLQLAMAPLSKGRWQVNSPSKLTPGASMASMKGLRGFHCENAIPNNRHVLWFSRKALFIGVWRHPAVPTRAQK